MRLLKKLALVSAATLSTLSAPGSAAAAPKPPVFDPHKPWTIFAQARLAGGARQVVVTYGAIPCPAGEKFHVTAFDAIPTHSPVPATVTWKLSINAGGLGSVAFGKGSMRVSSVLHAPAVFGTTADLQFSASPLGSWTYYTIGITGICAVQAPTVTYND